MRKPNWAYPFTDKNVNIRPGKDLLVFILWKITCQKLLQEELLLTLRGCGHRYESTRIFPHLFSHIRTCTCRCPRIWKHIWAYALAHISACRVCAYTCPNVCPWAHMSSHRWWSTKVNYSCFHFWLQKYHKVSGNTRKVVRLHIIDNHFSNRTGFFLLWFIVKYQPYTSGEKTGCLPDNARLSSQKYDLTFLCCIYWPISVFQWLSGQFLS